MAKIKKVLGREILDSRGQPTLETSVFLEDDTYGTASVPTGASRGAWEAVERRDTKSKRYFGLGVLENLVLIRDRLAPKLIGQEAANQQGIDKILIDADGSKKKENFGANTLLSLSIACAKAASMSAKIPPWLHIARVMGEDKREFRVPSPMMNLINGGKHGYDNLDFQEFLVVPSSMKPFSQSLQAGAEIYFTLRNRLLERHIAVAVGDEGGLAPQFFTNADALVVLVEAINSTIHQLGKDVFLSLDVAASTLKRGIGYKIRDFPSIIKTDDFVEYYQRLVERFRLLSIEDPLDQEDWDGWVHLNMIVGNQTLLVADDLVCTNTERLDKMLAQKSAGGLIVKPNQIGTISETIEVVKKAKRAGIKLVASHRSGETNDDFIADFAVGIGADFVKFGAPARGEHIAKYNRLLAIENQIYASS